MAIEGPLRELGVQDFFQLVDLGRKTGTLKVVRQNPKREGLVVFHTGRVVQAGVRGQPSTIEELLLSLGRVTQLDLEHAERLAKLARNQMTVIDILVQGGATSRREIIRLNRQHLERVVYELMSWHEGYFTFSDGGVDLTVDDEMALGIQSLVMESARQSDEWSRIADRVPDAAVVPALAHGVMEEGDRLHLRPREWQVLGLVNGIRDLRSIAASLKQTAFDVALILHGLAITGVVEIRR